MYRVIIFGKQKNENSNLPYAILFILFQNLNYIIFYNIMLGFNGFSYTSIFNVPQFSYELIKYITGYSEKKN